MYCCWLMNYIYIHIMKFILPSACPQCGSNDSGPTCCGKGGSWRGLCGAPGDTDFFEHTWDEGVEVCTSADEEPEIECPDNTLDPALCECGTFVSEDSDGCPITSCNIYCATAGTYSPDVPPLVFLWSFVIESRVMI